MAKKPAPTSTQPKPKPAPKPKAKTAKPKPAPKRKRGRPSTYTPEIGKLICTRLAQGESLRKICADPAMPSCDAVEDWIVAHVEFGGQYARARLRQADTFHEEVVEIADDASDDVRVVEVLRKGKKVQIGVVNTVAVHRARLRADVRLRVAARMNPKKWGDKQQIGLEVGPANLDDVPDEKLNAMIAERMKKAGLHDLLRGFGNSEDEITAVVGLFQVTELPMEPTPEGDEQ